MSQLSSSQSLKLRSQLKRVVIVDHTRPATKLLSECLRHLGAQDIYVAHDDLDAIGLAKDADPQVIFTEYKCPHLDGVYFSKSLRASEFKCRKAPIIMMTAGITASMLNEARNAGIDEFMLKPFAVKDVQRRLEAVLLTPRPWIEAISYIGPDRRRFNSSDYMGSPRRQADKDPVHEQVVQAIRILRSSAAHLDTDRPQAMRSMVAQLEVLVPNLSKSPNLRLKEALTTILRELNSGQTSQLALAPPISTLVRHYQIDAKKPPSNDDKDASLSA